jgi:hypothetical protein
MVPYDCSPKKKKKKNYAGSKTLLASIMEKVHIGPKCCESPPPSSPVAPSCFQVIQLCETFMLRFGIMLAPQLFPDCSLMFPGHSAVRDLHGALWSYARRSCGRWKDPVLPNPEIRHDAAAQGWQP